MKKNFGCQSSMHFECQQLRQGTLPNCPHGHIAVTGSPACIRKFETPETSKLPKANLSPRNIVRLTATNCALLPRLQPGRGIHFLHHFSIRLRRGIELELRGSRQRAVRDIQAANSKKNTQVDVESVHVQNRCVEKIQSLVINHP